VIQSHRPTPEANNRIMRTKRIIHVELPPGTPELNPSNYINRELSWLSFNRRVLAQAQDETIPLLERLKFLAIVSSNTDEFFMVRVASIMQKLKAGLPSNRPDGIQYGPLLSMIRAQVIDLMTEQRRLMGVLLQRLNDYGVSITEVAHLSQAEREALRRYFYDEIFPVLTPLAVDRARPFPFISNLSLNLAVLLRNPAENDRPDFVRLKIPPMLPRLVHVQPIMRKYASADHPGESGQETYIWIEDLIAANLDLLFPGMEVLEYSTFRITRNADIDYEQEEDNPDQDISDIIEENLRERRFGDVVRLSVPAGASREIVDPLVEQLGIDPERDLYEVRGALGGASLFQLASVDRPELKYPPHVPRQIDALIDESTIFDAIAHRDFLLHHPYDSFAPIETFFQAAAHDPDVLAIKATLYRVGRKSPIVQALMDARLEDKQVAVLVELKARFDEENNLEWARALEEAGVHVTYGVEELPVKTHAKIAMVVRREGDGVRRYVHLGTGNYNSSTARLYTDLGLLTCDREIADDATRLFNRLTGYAPATTYSRLLVAPDYLLTSLLALIDNEIAAARSGKPARLIFKMNQLEEDVVIRKLYEASQAGVQIDLLVRGICCLRPGIPGLSENIRVLSIVGRFLEHSRIFYFHNAPPDQRLYLGSADLMRRNLYNRVEVVFPILSPRIQRQVLRILATSLADNANGWDLQADDTYVRRRPAPGEARIDSHAIFMEDSFGMEALPAFLSR
jgi:polyphosphate kinase